MTPGAASTSVSVIIPARDEEALIASSVGSALRARDHFLASGGPGASAEVLVVDNASTDGTAGVLAGLAGLDGLRVASCEEPGAARARNLGARLASGRLLVFLDADTVMPPGTLRRFAGLCDESGYEAGIARLGPLDGGRRARCWWAFWDLVRRLPMARAKAMPACMFCTREAFDEFGPFDERVAIGEEWPILAGLYRARPRRLVFDRSTTALSSSRRMELQRFGYARTLARYAWAILSPRGRVDYPDHIRHAPEAGPRPPRDSGSLGSRWLGAILEKARLNEVERREGPGGLPMIAKRRHRVAPWLIAPGNLYLRWLGSGVLVLGDRRWKDRERSVNRRLHGVEAEVDPRGWLILPRWPGVTVEAWAGDPREPPGARLAAVSAASRALGELHRAEIDWPGDDHRGLSHGDATLRNVQYDPSTGRARWFDFDTIHAPGVPPEARLADDLRALLYSALGACADLPVPDVYGAVRGAYDDAGPWRRLRDDLARGPVHFSPYHFAQARPSRERVRSLEALIRRDAAPGPGACLGE